MSYHYKFKDFWWGRWNLAFKSVNYLGKDLLQMSHCLHTMVPDRGPRAEMAKQRKRISFHTFATEISDALGTGFGITNRYIQMWPIKRKSCAYIDFVFIAVFFSILYKIPYLKRVWSMCVYYCMIYLTILLRELMIIMFSTLIILLLKDKSQKIIAKFVSKSQLRFCYDSFRQFCIAYKQDWLHMWLWKLDRCWGQALAEMCMSCAVGNFA